MKSLLNALIKLFPAGFRNEFAQEIGAQVSHDYDLARARGIAPALWFTITTGADLAASGIAERWNPAFANPQIPLSLTTEKGMSWTFDEWARDLKHAARSLRRSKGFTAVSVGTLGLAIGATAGMFTVVDRVLLDPLPYANADRLVYIAASAPGSQMPVEFGVGAEFYVQYKGESKLLEDVASVSSGTATFRAGDRVERVRMAFVTHTLFSTLGAKPIIGRLPVEADEDRVALISQTVWQNWFGGDSAILGKSYEMAGGQRVIIGVLPADFAVPVEGTYSWIPGNIRETGIVPGRFGAPLVARMKPGVTVEALTAELNTLASRLPERFGGTPAYAKLITQHRAVVRTLEERQLGQVATPLWVLLTAVGVVLLIACANVANLFMVRSEGRQREMAVRRAIGAGRGQLVRLQLAESIVVAALAGALAITLTYVALPAFLRAAPSNVPRLGGIGVNFTTVAFTLGVVILAALACGLVPALRASSPDLMRLRSGGRGSTARGHWVRNGLVVGQTALALVLLISSGLLVRSFTKLSTVNAGYDTKDIFTFQIAPDQKQLVDGPTWAQFHLNFMDRLRALPGVQSVGLVENVPLDEGTAVRRFRSTEQPADVNEMRLNMTFAAADYFKVMGIKLFAGRPFTREDNVSTLGNVVISKSAASQLWPGKDPIGQQLKRDGLDAPFTVVGLVDDVLQNDWRDQPQGHVYFAMVGPAPDAWALGSPAYVVKTQTQARAETIAPEIRALVKEIAPEAPMYRAYTMEFLSERSMVSLRFTMLTLGIASTLALILGAVGLYGILSYVVAERTREIGVRMALGAEAAQVRRMVVVQGARVVAIGVVVGVAAAIASTRALGSLLFNVDKFDMTTFIAMSGSMVLVGLLASYMPARRASNVDPIESLRGE